MIQSLVEKCFFFHIVGSENFRYRFDLKKYTLRFTSLLSPDKAKN